MAISGGQVGGGSQTAGPFGKYSGLTGDLEAMFKAPPIEPIVEEAAFDPDLFEKIQDGRLVLLNRVQAYVNGPMTSPLLVRTTPGLGKTEVGVQVATSVVKKGLRVFYAVPTRNMALQIGQRIKGGVYGYGIKTINLEGRHEGYTGSIKNENTGLIDEIAVDPNCYNFQRIQKATARGYSPGSTVCPSCPLYPHHKNAMGEKAGFKGACRYYQTMYRAAGFVGNQNNQGHDGTNWAPIVLMTHQKLASIIADGSGDSMLKPDVVIIDEDWSTALRDTVSWSEAELVRQVKCDDAIINFRRLLVRSTKIANKYKHQAEYPCGPDADKDKAPNAKVLRAAMSDSKLYGSFAVWGRRLMLFMREAASQLGMDLSQVLMDASVASTGVSPGEYMSMSDARDATVPHHKEPELAQDLKMVLDNDTLGGEGCYRVSLRHSKESGWEYCWDSVRRMTYGGPVIMLDAYGDPEIVKRLCNDREPEVVTVKAKSRKNVQVHQYMCSTSRTTMDQKFDDIFDTYVDPYLRDMAGKSVLFYALKRFEEPLRKRIKEGRYGLAKTAIKWFWQDRGDDSYKEFDSVMVLGSSFSNVVAETHFANAVFYGETPLDWSVDKQYKHTDPRVRQHLQARQEKEMQQVCFRLRPASEAKEQEQKIIIISMMDLDLYDTFPGAQIYIHKHAPQLAHKKMSGALHTLFKYFRGWTPLFSAFIGIEQRVIAWFEAGGIKSGREFPVKYLAMLDRFKQWANSSLHKGFVNILDMLSGGGRLKKVTYNGKDAEVSGDVDRVLWALEQIKLATREPGVDDEPIDPADVQYDPMEDMDDLSIQAMDMALSEAGNANNVVSIAKAANEIHEQLKHEHKQEQVGQEQTAKVIQFPGGFQTPKKAPKAKAKPKPQFKHKTDQELYNIATKTIAAEFEDKKLTQFFGTMKFYLEVDALAEELQAERDFKELFDKEKKSHWGGEEPPEPPMDD